jgi:hypothetical protein
MKRASYDLARDFLETELPLMRQAVAGFAYAGQASIERAVGREPQARLMEAVESNMLLVSEGLETDLRLQIERDVAAVLGALRGMALREALSASPDATKKRGRGGAAEARAEALATLRFEFLDRSARRWPSPRHVRTLYRQAFVYAWNESALVAAAATGLDTLRIDHPDSQYAMRGELVAVTAEGDGITWQDALDEGVFHPQTHAWLSPISQE